MIKTRLIIFSIMSAFTAIGIISMAHTITADNICGDLNIGDDSYLIGECQIYIKNNCEDKDTKFCELTEYNILNTFNF